MDFIREITYEVWGRMSLDVEELIARCEIFTLLEIPEAQEALEARHSPYLVKILQYRAVPYLTNPTL